MSVKQESIHDICFYRPLIYTGAADDFFDRILDATEHIPVDLIRFFDTTPRIVDLSKGQVNRPNKKNPAWASLSTTAIRESLQGYATKSCNELLNIKPERFVWLENRPNRDIPGAEPTGILAVKFEDAGNFSVAEHLRFIDALSFESRYNVHASNNPGMMAFADKIPKKIGDVFVSASNDPEAKKHLFQGVLSFEPVVFG